MTYADLEARLFARARAGMKLGLDRMERALAAIGDPHLAAPVLHVAGTNGKGSTCAFLDASLRAAGLRTGLYTSPHLEHFGERLQVNGVPADEPTLVRLHEDLERLVPGAFEGPDALTFFELVTLLAFRHFAAERVDVMVVEVGLGGLLDATNVVRPLVSCIAPIGFDHQEFLGHTLPAIAREKAGIAKPGVPCASAAQDPEALTVLEETCAAKGAPLSLEGRDFRLIGEGRTFTYTSPAGRLEDVRLGLRGRHQRTNAAVALRALELAAAAGLPVTADHAREGLAAARWPGRLETVARGPEIVLDGAHNPHGAQALARTLPDVFADRTVHLVLGMLADKEAEGVVAALAPLVDDVTVTAPASPRALAADALAAIVRDRHPRVSVVPDPLQAVRDAAARSGPDDVVLVCGSLYLVGEVRAGLRGGRAGGPAEVLR